MKRLFALMLMTPAIAGAAPAADPTKDAPMSSYSSPMGRTRLKDCLLLGAKQAGISDAWAVEGPMGYRVALDRKGSALALIEGTETQASLRYYRQLKNLHDSSKRDAVVGGCRPK